MRRIPAFLVIAAASVHLGATCGTFGGSAAITRAELLLDGGGGPATVYLIPEAGWSEATMDLIRRGRSLPTGSRRRTAPSQEPFAIPDGDYVLVVSCRGRFSPEMYRSITRGEQNRITVSCP